MTINDEKADPQTVSKLKDIVISTLLLILFVASLFLTVLEIDIFRKTFIPLFIPLLLWLLPGLLLTPFLKKSLKLYEDFKSIYWQLFFNVITWGGLTVFGFMATNYYFASDTVYKKNFIVIDHGKLAKGRRGCNHPYVHIEYKGATKEIVFPCDTIVENKKTVYISLKKGLFGFEIISEQTLNSSADTDKQDVSIIGSPYIPVTPHLRYAGDAGYRSSLLPLRDRKFVAAFAKKHLSLNIVFRV